MDDRLQVTFGNTPESAALYAIIYDWWDDMARLRDGSAACKVVVERPIGTNLRANYFAVRLCVSFDRLHIVVHRVNFDDAAVAVRDAFAAVHRYATSNEYHDTQMGLE